jgi:alpha(1,3/1,4) fucosyltransferase
MISKIRNKINEQKKGRLNIALQMDRNRGRQIQFYNFWEQQFDYMFWNRFFEARPYLLKDKPDFKVGFFSVFGDRNIINKIDCDVNIFYTAENIKTRIDYSDHFLSEQKIGLSMGFEYFENERYVRFPNWMDVFFLKIEEIKSICQLLRFPNIENKKYFASCICSHDNIKGTEGLRGSMIDALNEIENVSCPGNFRHNDDKLKHDYNDNKLEYLKHFQFNICPENSNTMGYVTEKIFQAISVGCIPIYWGSYNRPELDVLNQDAIIFWNKDGDNSTAIKLINDLKVSPKLMKEFLEQPRLLPTAEEYIENTFHTIQKRIYELITL